MIFKSFKEMNINKKLGRSQLYTAFTLAEVLITLSIIGIVASITVPTLLNDSETAQFQTGLKKNFAALSQAHATAKAEYEMPYATFADYLTIFTKHMRVPATKKMCNT